jgi:hypothetical protein
VRDGVQPEAVEVGGRRPLGVLSRLATHGEGVVEPPELIRHEAPGVHEHHLEAGPAVERARVHETRRCNAGVEGVADGVRQVVLLEAGLGPDVIGMEHEWDAELVGRREHGLQLGCVKREGAAVRPDLSAEKTELAHRAPELARCRFRRLQRQSGEAEEPVTAGNELGERVVRATSEIGGLVGRRLVEEERRT